MADLNAITLAAPIASTTERLVRLASIAGVLKDDLLFFDQEAMTVLDASSNPVRVLRGAAGTVAARHVPGTTGYSGAPSLFHSTDPHGIPQGVPTANPYINVREGRVWVAQGDAVGPGAAARRWQLQSSAYATGALGILVPPTVTP